MMNLTLKLFLVSLIAVAAKADAPLRFASLDTLPGCSPEQPGPARAMILPDCSATKDYDTEDGSPDPPAATTVPDSPPTESTTTVVAPPTSSTPAAEPPKGLPQYKQCGMFDLL
ncbi:hypothetical protein NMY22_g16652 [Coprinellus aureogranulatus]|nr:hypothetical protein NMY22_g16652 [Coprinellus aureogranulatus]